MYNENGAFISENNDVTCIFKEGYFSVYLKGEMWGKWKSCELWANNESAGADANTILEIFAVISIHIIHTIYHLETLLKIYNIFWNLEFLFAFLI